VARHELGARILSGVLADSSVSIVWYTIYHAIFESFRLTNAHVRCAVSLSAVHLESFAELAVVGHTVCVRTFCAAEFVGIVWEFLHRWVDGVSGMSKLVIVGYSSDKRAGWTDSLTGLRWRVLVEALKLCRLQGKDRLGKNLIHVSILSAV